MAKHKFYRYPVYLWARFGAMLVNALPASVVFALAGFLAKIGFYLLRAQSVLTVKHLHFAFGPEKTEKEIKKIAEGVFKNLLFTAVEVLRFPRLTWAQIERSVDFENAFEVYSELLKEGRGLISMTAHVGNWELLAGIFGLKGFQGAVMGRRLRYEPFNRWVVGLREKLNVRTIYRDDSSREVLSLLAEGRIIGLLPDQDIDSLKGIHVPFFGHPAYTPVAPVRLALASGAPIICNFLIREPNGRFKIIVGGVLRPVVKTTRDTAVREFTEDWMRLFENIVRQYPEQWAWMHDRWKTQEKKPAEIWAEAPSGRELASA